MTFITLVPPIYTNVKQYGATGDGSTDDTAFIAAAIAAAGSNGTVMFPAGIYITTTQTLVSGVHLIGAGPGVTTLKLKNGANADLLSANTSLIALSGSYGTGNVGGVNNWSIRDMTLDGNKANQTSGTSYCVRAYGYNYKILNVEIARGFTGGLQLDWNGGDINTGAEVEARFSGCKIFDSNGIGLQIGGPHDTVFSDMHIMRNGSHGVHIAPNARGLLWFNSHSWGTPQTGIKAVPWLVEANSCQFGNCVGEGSDATNLVLLGSDTVWSGGHIYGAGTNAVYGIQLGQVASGTFYPGCINQSAGVATAITSSYNKIDTKISNCENGAINEVATSNNMYSNLAHQTAGTAIASGGGYLGGSSSAWVMVTGLTPDGSQGKGGVFQLADGSFSGIVSYDLSGNQLLSLNSYNGGLAVGNGRLLQGYSDPSFSTRTFQVDTSTGDITTSGYMADGQSASAATLATSGTIAVGNLGSVIVAPTAAVTGVILAAGSIAAQEVSVTNQSAFSITFAASGTSHVADGVSDVIAANNCRKFKWNSLNSLWYPSK